MRNSFLLTVLLFCVSVFSLSAQEYSTSVSLVSSTEDLLVVQSIGMSEKRKDAVDMAVRSAFYTLFYRGVNGYNGNKPLIQHDNSYYTKKFLTERYVMYVSAQTEIGEVERVPSTKKYKAQVEVQILIKALTNDLIFEKLMDRPLSDVSMEETKEEIGLPTITVVPYKQEGESYQEILQSDADLRMAIAKVQEGFNQLGASTIDFEGRLEAMWRSRDFNASAVQSEEKKLLDNSGADVYVVVDFLKDISESEGSRVSLNMKAYVTASGENLSSSVGWTNRFHTKDLDKLCVYAVEGQLKGFLEDLSLNFARRIDGGKSVVLRITRFPNSVNTLESKVGAQGYALSNVIRRWVRANSQNGKYHLQGVVADEMIFDDIKIPAKDVDGLPMDVAQFGDNLLYFLNTEMNVPCKMTIDGNSIYINLK